MYLPDFCCGVFLHLAVFVLLSFLIALSALAYWLHNGDELGKQKSFADQLLFSHFLI